MAIEFPSLIELPGREPKPPYGFKPNQQAQYDYITATEPNVWLWGNRGGGKSVTARWTCHARALTYPGYRYAILRTSFPELIKNHLIYLNAEMEALGGKYNGSKFIATYPNGSMGFYMQAETEEQTRNALGVEMMEVVFDEAPTFKWEHMMMIASSVRVPRNSGLTPLKRFNGNPIGPSIDDIWKYFIDRDVDREEDPEYRAEDWRSIEIRMEDNVDLDVVAYKKQLGAGLPIHLRKAWLDGVRFDARTLYELKPNVVVDAIDTETQTAIKVEKPYHVIEELPKAIDANGQPTDILTLPWVRIQGCYDDGFMDPAVMLWAVNVGSQVIVFNERVWQHTNSPAIAEGILDASEIVTEKGELYQLPLKTIYADPTIGKESTAVQSTQQVMQHLWKCKEHGINREKRCCDKSRSLHFEPSTNSRELFASAINRLLQAEIAPNVPKVVFLKPNPNSDAGRSLITRGIIGCPYLLKYLPKMQADLNDPRKMADHKHDHAVVAFAYLCMSYPIQTAPRLEEVRPTWWKDFFIGNSNVPKAQPKPNRRRR